MWKKPNTGIFHKQKNLKDLLADQFWINAFVITQNKKVLRQCYTPKAYNLYRIPNPSESLHLQGTLTELQTPRCSISKMRRANKRGMCACTLKETVGSRCSMYKPSFQRKRARMCIADRRNDGCWEAPPLRRTVHAVSTQATESRGEKTGGSVSGGLVGLNTLWTEGFSRQAACQPVRPLLKTTRLNRESSLARHRKGSSPTDRRYQNVREHETTLNSMSACPDNSHAVDK